MRLRNTAQTCNLFCKLAQPGRMGGTGEGYEPRHQDAELEPEWQLTGLLHGCQLGSFKHKKAVRLSCKMSTGTGSNCGHYMNFHDYRYRHLTISYRTAFGIFKAFMIDKVYEQ
jgi:hypothetical protein